MYIKISYDYLHKDYDDPTLILYAELKDCFLQVEIIHQEQDYCIMYISEDSLEEIEFIIYNDVGEEAYKQWVIDVEEINDENAY
ncbi:MAG: hypothetical protein R3Y57_06730 [Erysipelotrichaceae bacterium]